MDKLTSTLDGHFARLHERARSLAVAIPADKLYWQPRTPAGTSSVYSCGELILRSAATVEQTFGGITANLWDDPFEWTLPEALPTPEYIIEYLAEAEATRQRGFALLNGDEDLAKEIATPSGEMRTLFQLISETLVRAAHYEGRAFATFRLFSDARLPPL